MIDSNQPVQQSSMFGEAMLAAGAVAGVGLAAFGIAKGRKGFKNMKGKYDKIQRAKNIKKHAPSAKTKAERLIESGIQKDLKNGDADWLHRKMKKNLNPDANIPKHMKTTFNQNPSRGPMPKRYADLMEQSYEGVFDSMIVPGASSTPKVANDFKLTFGESTAKPKPKSHSQGVDNFNVF